MAIKIIKPGMTEFCGCCDRCGCEFSYELVDIQLTGKINCPTCGKDYYHPVRMRYPEPLKDTNYPLQFSDSNSISIIDADKDPCAKCDWLKKLIEEGSYTGDTPCTWCTKNKFIASECATKASVSSNSVADKVTLRREGVTLYE
jgi:hypothetical protein